jgi:hypothetical protein
LTPASIGTWDAITAFAIDPLFVLATFQHESKKDTEGVAKQTHTWDNTRKPSSGAAEPEAGAPRRPAQLNWPSGE